MLVLGLLGLCGRKDSNLIFNFRFQNESDSLSLVVGLYSNGCSKQGSKYVYTFLKSLHSPKLLRSGSEWPFNQA